MFLPRCLFKLFVNVFRLPQVIPGPCTERDSKLLNLQLVTPTRTRLRQQFSSQDQETGFSLIELSIVLAIILVVAAITLPSLPTILESIKVRGAADELAGFYQEARMRAIQDDNYYEVIVAGNPAGAFLDLGGNGVAAANPALQLPAAITLNNLGAPAGLDQKKLGFTPLSTETSVMFDQDGTQRPGLAWNSRGLPCQRPGPTSVCQTGIGWVQYLQYQGGTGPVYAAVSVSPASKVKVWTYKGGAWQ